jgi:hypothetical protein
MEKYYYSPSGDSGNSGTYASPKDTIGNAAAISSSGDQVIALAGNHTVANFDLAQYPGRRFTAHPGDAAVLRNGSGQALFRPLAATADVVEDVTVDHLLFEQTATDPLETFRLETAVENLTVAHCKQIVNAGFAGTTRGFMRLMAGARGLTIDGLNMDSLGNNFTLLQQDSDESADDVALTNLDVKGVADFLAVTLYDINGACSFSGLIEGDYSGDVFRVERSDRQVTMDCDLTVVNKSTEGGSAAIQIGKSNAGDTINIKGERLIGDAYTYGTILEFGISGKLRRLGGTCRSTTGTGVGVALRNDSTDSGTLAVKNFIVEELLVDAMFGNAAAHALLMGRNSRDILVRSGLILSDGYCIVDKGDYNKVFARQVGGAVASTYHKGARHGLVSSSIHQSAGGAAFRLRDDDTNSNRTSNNIRRVGCEVDVEKGKLFDWDTAGDDTGGSIVDHNKYRIADGASWGTLAGDTVGSLTAVKDKWAADYDVTTNDAGSREDSDLTIRGTVDDDSATTSSFDTAGLPLDTSKYAGQLLFFSEGDLRKVARKIATTSSGTTIVLTKPLPEAPGDGAAFKIGGVG